MEKEQSITISVEEYRNLLEIRSERDFEESEKYREESEKEYNEAKEALIKELFDICIEECDIYCVVDTILYQNPELVAEVFSNYSVFEIHGAVLDFVEYQEYYDPITGDTRTLKEWGEFFNNCDDCGTMGRLYERCKELFSQKNDLIKQMQKILDESQR